MKFSIIIPVYNTQDFLHNCIDSVLAQTYTDFELLLINDGSTDNSAVICNQYANSDKRINVVHKKNGGVSSARNIGINISKGEYIWFIDADDWVEPHALDMVFKLLKKDNRYLYAFSYNNIYLDKNIVVSSLDETLDINIKTETLKYNAIVVYFFNREIILKNQLYFDENMRYAEDIEFVMKYLFIVKKVSYSSDIIYNYRRDNLNSAMNIAKINQNETNLLYFHFLLINHLILFIKQNDVIINSRALESFFVFFIKDGLNASYRRYKDWTFLKRMTMQYREVLLNAKSINIHFTKYYFFAVSSDQYRYLSYCY